MKASPSRWLEWGGLALGAAVWAVGCGGNSQGTETPGAAGSSAGASGAVTAGAPTAGGASGQAGGATTAGAPTAGGASGQASGATTAGAGGRSFGGVGGQTNAGAGSVGGAQGGFVSVGGSSMAGSAGTGSDVVPFACDAMGCSDSEKYCRVARLNGALRLGECRAFPTSCKTCACALADYNHFLSQQNYSCTGSCSSADDHAAVGQNETDPNLVVSCGVP